MTKPSPAPWFPRQPLLQSALDDGHRQGRPLPVQRSSKEVDYEVTAEFEGKKARLRRLSQFDLRDITVFNFKLEPPAENTEKKDNP
jgi:hypothetical protein